MLLTSVSVLVWVIVSVRKHKVKSHLGRKLDW